ncbi:hypothetical protein ACPUER_18325 [Burkholderia sp. DN3021]|uniref:hypothetical protein n=1 Tax=Burkholderia sp. DN3021 TaxID=3410137 RepID=UPI00285B73AE|nr:hypothetical protein [Burkholderia ambifaria]MDR6503827.1 hypothetical protein [Burkholderia ambifaria]
MTYQADALMIEGITEGHYAITSDDGFAPHISVHDADGDKMFTLPAGWTPEQINAAIAVYDRGYRHGEKFGSAKAQRAIRDALGIVH